MTASLLVLCFVFNTGAAPADRWLGEDKFRHFFASFVVTSIAASGARAAGLESRQSLAAGATIGLAAGVWKEIRDARRPNGASARDMVWNAAGVAAGATIAAQAR